MCKHLVPGAKPGVTVQAVVRTVVKAPGNVGQPVGKRPRRKGVLGDLRAGPPSRIREPDFNVIVVVFDVAIVPGFALAVEHGDFLPLTSLSSLGAFAFDNQRQP